MAEEIYTGGLKKFVRASEKELEIEPELERGIEEGYEKAGKRKRRNFWIKVAVILLIIILVLGFVVF